MSFLCLYPDGSLSRLKHHTEDDTVPAEAICWYVEQPKLNRALKHIKRYWIAHSIHDKGALLAITQEEAAEELRVVLGPSLEQMIQKRSRPSWWVYALLGISATLLALLWWFLKTLILIALIPTLALLVMRGFK